MKALFNNLKDDNVDIINITKERLDERVSKVTEIEHVDHIQYRWTLDQLVSRYKKLKKETLVAKVIKQKNFVFIIDEINRGEISKIFGELFFSIDPGYRGEKGRVQTQYQNIVEDGDIFKKGFFVPENVYIIGTMNDIDRSVESMDFAFRRRFAFKEVTATDSQKMLDSDDAWGFDDEKRTKSRKPSQNVVECIQKKMNAVNNRIWHKVEKEEKEEDKPIEGLSSSYHIGASYFLKLANYRNAKGEYDQESFDNLWKYHLDGLLHEYLRGNPNADKFFDRLKDAYDSVKLNNNDNGVADSNNGQ